MRMHRRFRRGALFAAILVVVLGSAIHAPSARGQTAGSGRANPAEAVEPSSPSGKPAREAPIAARQDAGLKERTEGFYAFLRGRQVNIHSLYENETFRSYFVSEEALENYISYITARLGEHKFRKYRIERTELEGVKQAGPDRAMARVKLIGRHRDTLVFWDQDFAIEDEWRRVEAEWYVFPPPF